MTGQWWAEPTASEIVWCHFPDSVDPRLKPKPALVHAVFDYDDAQFHDRMTYGHVGRHLS
jgi:hypothetical protein